MKNLKKKTKEYNMINTKVNEYEYILDVITRKKEDYEILKKYVSPGMNIFEEEPAIIKLMELLLSQRDWKVNDIHDRKLFNLY